MIKHYRKAVAVLAIAGPLALGLTGVASASTHPDATPACSSNCFDLSSLLTGHDIIQNAYIPGGNGVAVTAPVGTRLNMKQGSDSYRQEDFTLNTPGLTVSDFCAPAGFPVTGQEFPATSYVCIHDSGDPVYEANWSPDGDESGNCVGVAVANLAGEKASLQPCGATVKTLWIGDEANAHIGAVPWINGGDLNFSHPLILTENAGTHSPVNELFVQRENLLTGGFVDNSQMFKVHFGVFVG
jgi:hypothetical protein